MTDQTPAPGWYADPTNGSQQRYWDGNAWTEHTAPTGAPATGQEPGAEKWIVPVGQSWQSVVATWLGLFCLLAMCGAGLGPFGALFALLVGGATIAVSVWASKLPTAHGRERGRTIIGLAGGGLCTLAGVLGLAASFGA